MMNLSQQNMIILAMTAILIAIVAFQAGKRKVDVNVKS